MELFRYTSLFFDLDNTIWDFKRNSEVALELALDECGVLEQLPGFDEFLVEYNIINDQLWKAYRERTLPKAELIRRRFEESIALFLPELSIDGEFINEAYLKHMSEQTHLIDGAREVLDYFHGKVRMFIITNGFRQVQLEKLEKSDLAKYFERVFISEVIGSPKPNKKIFEMAIKTTNSKKSNSIIIGDSWDADIVGGKNFGIDQVYFSPKNEFYPNSSTKTSTFFINQLSQLYSVIKK
ncbi:noncanonical pyrimidine nucleotidase, YjjG family [Prolixibacteraceae bacterium JC049]|nr:noncanonical pyrimidine nucleotidase, YjjG family [Prolixibacteraceae bacterium JC049]